MFALECLINLWCSIFLYVLHILSSNIEYNNKTLFSGTCGNQCSLAAGQAAPQLELTSPSLLNCIPPVIQGYVTNVYLLMALKMPCCSFSWVSWYSVFMLSAPVVLHLEQLASLSSPFTDAS